MHWRKLSVTYPKYEYYIMNSNVYKPNEDKAVGEQKKWKSDTGRKKLIQFE